VQVARPDGARQTRGQQDGNTPLRYIIQTPVPEFWIPLVPVSLDPIRSGPQQVTRGWGGGAYPPGG
jgi:hypothetical protein